MLVKEEADMGADERERGLGRRVCRRKKKAVHEPDFVYQKRGRRENRSLKKKGRHAHELFRNSRLVKIELDAAQALADFSRLAHLPVQQCPSDLKWFVRRKRTIRSVELQGARIMNKICGQSSELRTSELESTTSLSHGDKASPIFDCRAESPSSPLPSSKLACKGFLVNGSKLSIRRDASAEVMQKSIKTEMKELEPVVSSVVKQKSSVLKPQMPLCLVKMEPLGEISSSKGEGLQHSKVQPLCNLASQLVELSRKTDLVVVDKGKQKTTLSENDKEARRLRRIQANRESARQTIRKKQLLCEELKRQSASLALENDAMKQKRDMFMQELALLRGQNYHLKMQLDLRASNYQGSQEPLPQLASLPLGQAPGNDSLVKNEITWECVQKLGSKQCMNAFGTVPGIPASSLGYSSMKNLSSNLDLSVSEGGWNHSSVAGTETGPPCEADSTTSDFQRISGEELKTDLESAIEANGLISRHNSQSDCDLVENHSTSGAPEHIDCQLGLTMPLPVACGSFTAGVGSVPMNGHGFFCSYPWRMTHATPTAAAKARKRRKELTQKKRLGAKASKLVV
ncbi:hypothetical protein L7F22_025393 [Adiantum nelumboides]|nr:hypothetical protein [Adiantum nelumboides]